MPSCRSSSLRQLQRHAERFTSTEPSLPVTFFIEKEPRLIKLNILVPRRPDITHEEFSRHWRDTHGPLFASQPEVKQFVRKYVQDHRTGAAPTEFGPTDFDGIAEIWFDDMTGFRGVFDSKNYRDVVTPDEERFVDRKRAQFLISEENAVIG